MLRILMLDDESQMFDLMQMILEPAGFVAEAGYELIGTTDTQEALTILRTQSIDLFTQDFARPDINGVELLQIMKSDPALASIPVLAITAGSWEMRSEQLEAAGLDIERDLVGFMRKPFSPVELVEGIKSALKALGYPVPQENAPQD